MLTGNAAVEAAAQAAGQRLELPFTPGRVDATQAQTDVEGFDAMEPQADGFRNYHEKNFSQPVEKLLVDKAQLLTLTAPEMTVLVDGLETNFDGSKHGVFTDRPGQLTNDLFVNLADMGVAW